MNELEEVHIAALCHYAYCPKSAYIAYVTQEFVDNEFTIQGREIHSRVDSSITTKRKELYQIRSIWLKSEKYGLIGKSDLIEENKGEIYPVEYKRGKVNDWIKAEIQLTAQALCIEEMLNLKEQIKKGFIYYHLSNTRDEVLLTSELRELTIKTISEFRQMLVNNTRPDIPYSNKCPNCSVYPVCLPHEVQKIKDINIKNLLGD